MGVAPNGVITYISNAYSGSTSDKKIVGNCGLLEKIVAGDLILADTGFLIQDMLPAGVSTINIPPFLNTPQFTESEVYETKELLGQGFMWKERYGESSALVFWTIYLSIFFHK